MRTILISLALAFTAPFALACDHEKMGGPMKEPTKEERTQMAAMHTKMAECLGSDKTMADCHKEMADSCPMAKDGKSCPMMAMGAPHGKGPHGHGPKGKGKMSKDKKTDTEKSAE